MFYIELFERRNINGAEAIHAASDHESEIIKPFGFKTPIAVVPRGLEISEYTQPGRDSTFTGKYPQLKDKRIAIFLGRIHPKKGLDLLAHAFKEVLKRRKDVYLIIAGPEEGSYAGKVKKLFRESGITEHTLFTGMLLNSEKISALYSSDIFILPSYGENFGIAALEAMACKLPIIITNRVGIYPDVSEYKAGIVTDCDSKKIADAVLRLLDNEDLRKSMGERGQRLVRDRFTMDKTADKMVKVYEDILECRG